MGDKLIFEEFRFAVIWCTPANWMCEPQFKIWRTLATTPKSVAQWYNPLPLKLEKKNQKKKKNFDDPVQGCIFHIVRSNLSIASLCIPPKRSVLLEMIEYQQAQTSLSRKTPSTMAVNVQFVYSTPTAEHSITCKAGSCSHARHVDVQWASGTLPAYQNSNQISQSTWI